MFDKIKELHMLMAMTNLNRKVTDHKNNLQVVHNYSATVFNMAYK